jgi:dipeptidyl aminopeptidase/acylaminoacyl peptidase/uncharacterized protein (DUF885 family)
MSPEASTEASSDSPQRRTRNRSVAGAYKLRLEPHWVPDADAFWYRNDLAEEAREYFLVNCRTGQREPAFDHDALAAALQQISGVEVDADRLSLDELRFTTELDTVLFRWQDAWWSWERGSSKCEQLTAGDDRIPDASDVADTPTSGRDERSNGRRRRRDQSEPIISPDGMWRATVRDGNIVVRQREGGDDIEKSIDEEHQITQDGSSERSYRFLEWAPDSQSLVAFQFEPGDEKPVYRVESSPEAGGRAVLHERPYALPGDKLPEYRLVVVPMETRKPITPAVDPIVMEWGRPRIQWCNNGRDFLFYQIDRGHQRLRIQRVDSVTGKPFTIFEDVTDTFIWTAHTENLNLELVNWLPESEEVIYASERDGWRHLYLLDAVNGGIKSQITFGNYVVRGIDRIDTDNRTVWFHASGKNPKHDPYFMHYFRVGFDGTHFVQLTAGDGYHSATYSPDSRYLIDSYSRVNQPPIHTLRRAADGALICELERADITELQASGFQPLKPFVAKGRDGLTDIHGVICWPKDFDPTRKYPVLESIYAGPQDSYVPKSFSPGSGLQGLADLGFIVVQIDGMGTANRSKAFHDVCWHNLKDAGFPDRMLWIKAAARKYPQMDLARVGLYGGSAGGQNAAAALLFHHDFYHVAVAGCGCHDNRMDKASWNEQWMGYPVGPQYSDSSNIDNAHRLQGKLMLILGEMDDNVPPESTLRFVDALIKADKDFEFVFVPGAGHGMGGRYGDRRMREFFVEHLITRASSAATNRPSLSSTGVTATGVAADASTVKPDPAESDTRTFPSPSEVIASPTPVDRIAELADRYRADMVSLRRFYRPESAPASRTRRQAMTTRWLSQLDGIDVQDLTKSERSSFATFRNELLEAIARQARDAQNEELLESYLPYAPQLYALAEDRWSIRPLDAAAVAQTIDTMAQQVEQVTRAMLAAESTEPSESSTSSAPTPSNNPTHAKAQPPWPLILERVDEHREYLRDWNTFYDGYDPSFSWWVRQPHERLSIALTAFTEAVQGKAASDESKTKVDGLVTTALGSATSEGAEPFFARTAMEVPDVQAILARPRGHMESVLKQFVEEQQGQRRSRGGRNRRDQRRESRREGTSAQSGQATGATAEERAAEGAPSNRDQQALRRRRMLAFEKQRLAAWLAALEQLDFEALAQQDRVDYLLLKSHLRDRMDEVERIEQQLAQTEAGKEADAENADRSASTEHSDRSPDASAWQPRPPIGHDALMQALKQEMIDYTPEQLVAIARKEYQWCEAELLRASHEMGYGDNWHAAVEHVKRMHVQPGEQPKLIHELAWEAIEFLKAHDVVTVPPLAAETWVMEMMTPERQLVNPFFTGGPVISVSFPTDTMSHDDKLQSLRGNNVPFARATVHHELIPGHNLQSFAGSRYRPDRRMFGTPFWTEGWALYWEMRLYDMGFPKTPEDRIGFLVWRSHRCARIIFSLSYHLGTMTPEECVDFLVSHVGFERKNAAAEVRRSFEGSYPPLYQAAYMLGGLQFRQLHRELVLSGRMTEREFHDGVLAEGNMPIVMVRALLMDTELTDIGAPPWYFYGTVEQPR